jgi:valyl-tRNA synthetase
VSSEAEGPAACETCGRTAAELTQDPDIFDTWYSSGLWPFSTLGWPDETEDLRRYYPGTVMETGYDIIFFWVARMMMLGIHLAEKPPFAKVYLHGLVKDPTGQKMAKSKGNVVDPLEAIEQTGADALRFALLNGTSPGNDQKFSNERLEDGRNFANKLWNATRFVLGARPSSISAERAARREAPDASQLGPAERWLRSRAAATIVAVDKAFAEDNLGEVTRTLYDAIWSEYCDWGIELAKVRLTDGSLPDEAREATWWTLVETLDTYLRLLHPIMPFVTEALWASMPHAAEDAALLIVARWPVAGARDAAAEAAVAEVLGLISAIRNARAEAGIEPGRRLRATIEAPASLAGVVEQLRPAIDRLARIESSPAGPDGEGGGERGEASGRLAVLAGKLAATLERGAEAGDDGAAERDRARLEKELAETESRLAGARSRLADPRFTERAPAAIVDGARKLEAELAAQADRIRAQLGG